MKDLDKGKWDGREERGEENWVGLCEWSEEWKMGRRMIEWNKESKMIES